MSEGRTAASGIWLSPRVVIVAGTNEVAIAMKRTYPLAFQRPARFSDWGYFRFQIPRLRITTLSGASTVRWRRKWPPAEARHSISATRSPTVSGELTVTPSIPALALGWNCSVMKVQHLRRSVWHDKNKRTRLPMDQREHS